jgi:PAS domain S-box-containing protein
MRWFMPLALLFVMVLGANAAQPKRVLIVHSFGTAAPPFTTTSRAFETELVKEAGQRVDIDEVSLDMTRYADDDMQEALVEYLQKRQAKWVPDLVVPIGSPSALFVAAFRERLFPEAAILYTSLDRRRLPPSALQRNATFIGEDFNIPGFMEEMLQIAPATKNIAVVIGASPLEQYWAAQFRQAFKPFENRVKFIWLNDQSFEQMLERVKTLPPNSFIFLVLLLRDANGVSHNADEALQRMHAVANAPINSIFEHQLGLGIVGGRLYQAEYEGVEAARMAIRILDGGELPSKIPPKIVGPLAPRYDWRELQRWHIDQKLLPPGSTVFYRTHSVWERYRWAIGLGISVCVGEGLLISALLANLWKRRRAEHSLAESNARFRRMADAAPVMIWISGPDKLCTFVNKAWLRFTGRKMEQEVGNGWSDGVHPDDFQKCLETYVHSFDQRKPFVMQYRLRHHDGEYRWINDNGLPRHDPDGEFLGYMGSSVDITDLLEKDDALQRWQERVTLATDTAHLGIWELNTETRNIWMSEKARELFQFDVAEEVSYAAFQTRIHPDDRPAHDREVKRAIEEHGSYEVEYRNILPNGTIRWIAGRARCVKDTRGEWKRLLGVSMDITKRKQDQELFHLATEASPCGTLLINDKGRIVLLNAHIEELFGYSRDKLIDQPVDILLPERFAGQHPLDHAHSSGARETRAIGEGNELFARRKDGSEFPVEIGLNPVETSQGVLTLAIIVDISARKAAEEKERAQREEIDLLSRLSLLGEMTASLAHELNQPLSAIISNSSAGSRFMEKPEVDQAVIKEILADVAADAHRAYDIIRNVRNTVKKGGPVRQAVNLNEVIRNVIRMIHPDAAQKACEVETSLENDLPPIEADPVQIQQVLINLVGNAFDAMRELPVADRKVRVATRRNTDGTIQTSIRDRGPGIPKDAQERIFEHFFTTKGDGLGMGLAIVRSIVESHGGQIAAENVNGGGACFRFTLPPNKNGHDAAI